MPGTDLDCDQLYILGISDIQVVGEDNYFIDTDGDGTACESQPGIRTATPFGKTVADSAPIGLAIGVPIVVVLTVYLLRQARQIYRASRTPEERRAHQMAFLLTIAAAIPFAIVTALVFALIGIR